MQRMHPIILQNVISVLHQTTDILTAIYVISKTKRKKKKNQKEKEMQLILYTLVYKYTPLTNMSTGLQIGVYLI